MIDYDRGDASWEGRSPDAPSGLGVQRRGDALFVAHAMRNEVRIFDKRDGRRVGAISLDAPVAVAVAVVRFELKLLAELGFGLDLERCAATGEAGDLGYVSPKSGRAVSRAAGEPWRNRP